MAQVKSDVKKTGDLGIVAEKSKSNQKTMFKPARLTVKSVFDKLKDISEMTGQAVCILSYSCVLLLVNINKCIYHIIIFILK